MGVIEGVINRVKRVSGTLFTREKFQMHSGCWQWGGRHDKRLSAPCFGRNFAAIHNGLSRRTVLHYTQSGAYFAQGKNGRRQ